MRIRRSGAARCSASRLTHSRNAMLSITAASRASSSPLPTNSHGKSDRQNGAPRPPTPFMNSGSPAANDCCVPSAASARSTSMATRSRSQSSALPAPFTVPSWLRTAPSSSAHSTLRRIPSGSGIAGDATRWMKAPVPTLTSAQSGSGRPKAKAAADWSPVHAVSGTRWAPSTIRPKAQRVGTQAGRCRGSRSNSRSNSGDHCSCEGSYSRVRDALAGSTTHRRSSVRRETRKLDSGPQARSPVTAARCTAGTWSRYQRSLLAP